MNCDVQWTLEWELDGLGHFQPQTHTHVCPHGHACIHACTHTDTLISDIKNSNFCKSVCGFPIKPLY